MQGDESDEEDQECALSDQWTFQRHSRRWSRIVNLPDDMDPLRSAAAEAQVAPYLGNSTDGNSREDVGDDDADRERTNDAVILGSFRRSSSERLKHGAKSLLRRMESLRSRSRRRPLPASTPAGAGAASARNGLVISGPQLVDALAMQDRMKELNCVDLTPPDSATPSSTPSPDLNRVPGGRFESSATPSPCSSVSQASCSSKAKSGRRFFQRRSFRPTSSSQDAGQQRHKDAHSDSECSPGYWRRSFSSSKDANSNETPAWNTFDSATSSGAFNRPLLWKSKKAAAAAPATPATPGQSSSAGDDYRPWAAAAAAAAASASASASAAAVGERFNDMRSLRGRLYLNFKPTLQRNKASIAPSPDDLDDQQGQTPTPCGSLRDAERKVTAESDHLGHDSTSTGTGTSGSHIDSDYSPAASGRCASLELT